MKHPRGFLSVCMNPTLQKTLRFSALIPGEVNRTACHRLDASGKGINVTRVLRQLGKGVLHLTGLGGGLRPLFLELCEKDGLDVRWVESGGGIRFCYTLVEGMGRGNTVVTELVEEGEQTEAGTEERLLAAYGEVLDSAGTVIISGTKAPGYSGSLVPEMARLAREQGCRIILDVRDSDLRESLLHSPDVVKPNLFEFTATFSDELGISRLPGDKAAAALACRAFLAGHEEEVKARITALALTLSADRGTHIILSRGELPVWHTGDGGFTEYPVEKTAVLNTIGSGDAFTAGLAAALDEGLPFCQAIPWGIHCGALNAGFLKPGVICSG
ncbi:MAG: PfkB family carbohydrate kinase [Treponema sp.]|nr:PfkB family carbohydrate kinase [Treponema sp.]